MVSVFAHIACAIILGLSLVSSAPKGTFNIEIYNSNCKRVDTIAAEKFYIGPTHILFDSIDRGYLKISKDQIKEMHISVVGENKEFLMKAPTYDVENTLNSECKFNMAFRVDKRDSKLYNK